MSIIFITGASSGIGYQTAELLAKQGHTVFGAARRTDKIAPLTQFGVTPVALDLTQPATIEAAVKQVLDQAGHIDILINNAGYGSYGAIEDVPLEDVRRQFEVNLFGLARLTQLVLSGMRQQHAGRIINTSSMGGRFTTYMGAWYHATKYALEAFSDALRMETKAFGIHVSIIDPGGIQTPWGQIAADHLRSSSANGAYAKAATNAANSLSKVYQSHHLTNPQVIANAIAKAANSRHPHARYLLGAAAKPAVFLHTVLPTKAFDWLMMHY